MPFQVNDNFDVPVIEIEGKFLGSLEGEQFKGALEELKKEGKTNVVVDLSKADFMDSSGIGVLLSGHTSMRREGGEIRLSAMEKRIKAIFLMTKLLGHVFDNYETASQAVQSFEDNPPEPAPEMEE